MPKINPYISLDIETTGLNITKAQVLEVACVYDDGVSEISQLPKFRKLYLPVTDYYEYEAMAMHGDLLKELAELRKGKLKNTEESLHSWLSGVFKDRLITLAGKNIGGFDLTILKNNHISIPNYHHRIIDVGSMYYPLFGYVPSLDEINKLNGHAAVSHRALDDAFNVVQAIRKINA